MTLKLQIASAEVAVMIKISILIVIIICFLFDVLSVAQSDGCLHFCSCFELSEPLALNEWVNSDSAWLKLI